MHTVTTNYHAVESHNSWGVAYKRFLLSADESLFLKIAPLFLLLGSPEILISNLIPVVGEVVDLSALSLAILVVLRTWHSTRKYR